MSQEQFHNLVMKVNELTDKMNELIGITAKTEKVRYAKHKQSAPGEENGK